MAAATFAVRVATLRDIRALVALCDALNAHLDMPTGRLRASAFRDAMFGRSAFVFADVAEAPGEGRRKPRLVGYALSHDAFSTDFGERGMFLIDLYVEPDLRRAGVGRALMKQVAKRTKARGGTHVWWASATSNRQARRFYGAIGADDERFRAHTLSGRDFEKLARP